VHYRRHPQILEERGSVQKIGRSLDMTPASWPIGMGREFLGTYDLFGDALLLFEPGVHEAEEA
jgi:peptide subunit release factor RF-3